MVNRKGLALSKVEGFTLIEAMISVGVISLIIPIIFSLLFVSLRSQLKMNALKSVKNNGDFALTYITDTIRESAYKIVKCDDPNTEVTTGTPADSPVSSVCFRTKNKQCFEIMYDSDSLVQQLKAQNVAGCDNFLPQSTPLNLTNNSSTDVTVDNAKIFVNITATGSNARFNTNSVIVSFRVVSKKDQDTFLNYYSKMKLRNY